MTTEIKPHSTRVNHTHKKAFPLSDDDLENLGNYLHGHRPAVSKGIHLYQNIFDDANAKENIMKNSSLFNDTYLSSFKDYYSKPSGVSAFDLELAISGMPKNSKLPVPYRNYSLMDGRFGDDAGFTMHGMENNFLGSSFRLL